MKDGYIMQVGTPDEVFDSPKNLFVAEFIGAPKMNTFRCQLIKENGEYYVTPFGSKLKVDGYKGEELKKRNIEPQEVILGVRPEHMVLGKDTDNDIDAKILVNEMMGSELHLHVVTRDNTELIIRVPTVDLSHEQRSRLVNGHEFHITFKGNVMNFFDVNTEENLLN
jgi:multiple sugar transport system ATP-binding protein